MTEKIVNGIEVYNVLGPDMLREKLIPLHTEGAKQIGARFGEEPARASLSRWRVEGYPINRSGPRVRLPYVIRLKKVYTSTAALARWMSVIQTVTEEINTSGGLSKWRDKKERS